MPATDNIKKAAAGGKDRYVKMSEAMPVQWYPGHMAKTKRNIEKNLKLVDAVAEIVDARIPKSSRNPVLGSIIRNKPRVILMNKCDMADPDKTSRWIAFYRGRGIRAIPVDCRSGKGLNAFMPLLKDVLKEQTASWRAKGMEGRKIRVMAAGVPNVGKSSLINRLTGGAKAAVENRPGVTRGSQWFSIGNGFELLDTPGVLWPKFDDRNVGEKLAFTGAVKDDVLDTEQLACRLSELLRTEYPALLAARYKLDAGSITGLSGYEMLELIGRKRGMLVSGGETDTLRAANTLLEEFRTGKIGRITLEQVKNG